MSDSAVVTLEILIAQDQQQYGIMMIGAGSVAAGDWGCGFPVSMAQRRARDIPGVEASRRQASYNGIFRFLFAY
jgi:hypothetical protein